MKKFVFNILFFLLVVAYGCESYQGLAPTQPERNLSRGYYYNTNHWPYSTQPPMVKIPAQFLSGIFALPSMLFMVPVTVWTMDRPVLSKAVRKSEKLYMETPGYALYMAAGTPAYAIKYSLWDAPIHCYYYMFEDSPPPQKKKVVDNTPQDQKRLPHQKKKMKPRE